VVTRALLALLAFGAFAACSDTGGDVLTTLDGDGGANGPDAEPNTPDADVRDIDANPACGTIPDCPTPNLGAVTVCGYVVDLTDSSVITAGEGVTVQFFNFIDFGSGPSLAEVEPDACGWFQAENIGGLFPGIAVMSTEGDGYSRTVAVISTTLGSPVLANALALTETADQAWADAAGLGGPSFSDVGALLMLFFDVNQPAVFPFQGTPAAGVAITEDGAVQADDDYYFADGDPLSRTTIGPALTVTGPNGSGLIINTAPLSEYTGDRPNCSFDNTNGVLPGIVQAQEIYGTCN
jgi:hypothetical protein